VLGRRSNGWTVVALVVATFIIVLFVINKNIKPTLSDIAKNKARLMGVECINKAINKRVIREVEYADLVIIRTDDRGRVVLVQPNTARISGLIAQSSLDVAKALDELSETSFTIPLGQAAGPSFLAGYGPKVRVKIIPVGSVDVDVVSDFQSAGINQSRHLIYLKVSSKLKVVVPFSNEEVKVATTIPVAETIIVGDVPGMYVGLQAPRTAGTSGLESLYGHF